MKNSEQPISPITLRQIGDNDFRIATEKDIREGQFLKSFGGITKREYFAGLAMQSMCGFDLGQDNVVAKEYAKRSVVMADALLAELEKQNS